ncbi:MAG: formylglycine-generating enzyme family protein [Planctomycetaceae bacterium]|nr:formylglycine-generating enzyme family protein [Planctomycetaceae bacterium]
MYYSELPKRTVRIERPFYMSQSEVTRKQFRFFVEQSSYVTSVERDPNGPFHLTNEGWKRVSGATWKLTPGFDQDDRHPVIQVSHDDARAFCDWFSNRTDHSFALPSEAAWEYACRAGTVSLWSVEESAMSAHAWFNSNSQGKTNPVKSKQANNFGLFDMHGNVCEWCADESQISRYDLNSKIAPQSEYLFRGGAWNNELHWLRSASRDWNAPKIAKSNLGFRVLAEIELDTLSPE